MRKFIFLVLCIIFMESLFSMSISKGKTISVKAGFHTFGRSYDIKYDNKTGKVEGKILKMFGDVFTLTFDGQDLGYEEQIKRWNGLRSINRLSIIKDMNGYITGYLGEESLNDIFNPGFLFHIYDAEKNEIGYSDEQVFSLLKKNAIYNKNKVKEYEIKQNFTFWFNEYIITCLVDKPTIKPEIVIYLTTIEDAIINAEKDKKKKSDKKKK